MISTAPMTMACSSYEPAHNIGSSRLASSFCLLMREKATWVHPRSRQWHLLDHVLDRRQDRRDVLVTKAIADTDGSELAQRLDNLLVAAAASAAGENASVESPSCATAAPRDIGYLDGSQGRGDPRSADRKEWKNFSGIKSTYRSSNNGTAHLLSADGRILLTEKTLILQRWAGYFRGILNCPSTISVSAIACLPQVEINADRDLPPSLHETTKAVQQPSSEKAPGSVAIPAEIYKRGESQLMDHLTALFQEMWRQGEIPQDFWDAKIIHPNKRKRSHHLCDNHQSIPLLHITGKIFVSILLNRLTNHLKQGLLPESQCGFRRQRGTTDMIFANHQLQETSQEMRI
nr:unnamed protein product [Spirometra erinaceieuropaei]